MENICDDLFKKLMNDYSNIFDFSMINSKYLMKLLLKYQNSIDNLTNEVSDLKNTIDSQKNDITKMQKTINSQKSEIAKYQITINSQKSEMDKF